MLTLTSRSGITDCGGTSRRDLLKIGALGLGGLSLPSLFRTQAEAAAAGSSDFLRDRSVVLLFLCGGPPQMETFDPKMTAPSEIRSTTGELKTKIPGVTFGGTFPKLAARADQLAIVRSFSPHKESDHAKAIKLTFIAGDPANTGASMGAMYARLRGNRAAGGVPPFAELIENELEPDYREDMVRMRAGNSAGRLGANCAPFAPTGGGKLNQDMQLGLPLERLQDRRALLGSLDRLNRQVDSTGAMAELDAFNSRAVQLLLGKGVRDALDLSQEDPRVVERYDTGHMQAGYLERRPDTLGRQMLVARRLCEAGCGFVTVGQAGWDFHANQKHPNVEKGMYLMSPPVDHAVATFLDDIRERGLSEKIVLVITGEFGRTPKLDKNGGRDHWPSLCPLVFAGAGVRPGQVIGQSSWDGAVPTSEPYDLSNLMGTIMHSLFDVGQLRLERGAPSELIRAVEAAKPIEPVFAG
ncbi:MAG: DUF1501 domain-containing protein [Pirellulales bacterium]